MKIDTMIKHMSKLPTIDAFSNSDAKPQFHSGWEGLVSVSF